MKVAAAVAPRPLRRMKFLPFSRRSSLLVALCWLPSASLAHADPGAKRPAVDAKLRPAAGPLAAKSTAPCASQPATAMPVEPAVKVEAPVAPVAATAASAPVAPSPWSTTAPTATVTVALPATPSVARLIENARRGPRDVRDLPGGGAVVVGPLADPTGEPVGPVRLSSREKWSLVTAGVGLASLGVMVGFGLHSLARHSEHEAGCASETGCTPAANEALDSSRTSAHVSHAFGLLGALSLGTSAYLFFFRSDSKPRRVGVMPIFGLSRDVGLAAGGMTMKASWLGSLHTEGGGRPPLPSPGQVDRESR